jgi:hypothetical protein
MYRFGRNESAVLLLLLTIAAAGFYSRFNNELATIQIEQGVYYISGVTA